MLGRLGLFYNQYIAPPPAPREDKHNDLCDRERYTVFAQGAFTALGLRAFCSLDLAGMVGYSALFCFSAQIANFGYEHRDKIQLLAKDIVTDIITYTKNKAATITAPTTPHTSPGRPRR
jgi:hypothetical protein